MREAAEQPAYRQAPLAQPAARALVPSFALPETFVAGPCQAHATELQVNSFKSEPTVITRNLFYESQTGSVCHSEARLFNRSFSRPAPPAACCEPMRPEAPSRLKWLAQRPRASSKQREVPPNPSIERTSKGLRPFAASHVKR